jgi:hypothetical protein
LKSFKTYIYTVILFLVVFSSCKTNKNTFIHRGYHNLTARFNGYYYATESIKEGEAKIRKDYKYDYDRLLPVFLVPSKETCKATFPEFDKAIKKSSNCIQRHTIKDKKDNEIVTAGKWIDNNWNVIGISNFYKRDFFSGIEAFEYVIRSYKSKDKYKAMIWLARSYNELGAPSQAEPIIGVLKDDKKISKYAKNELPAVQADYFIKRGMFSEAEQALLRAIKSKTNKKDRARYAFIVAQLYEQQKNNSKAREYYQKTISAKPTYDLLFNAQMKKARLVDLKNGNPAKLIKDLEKMARDFKNKEYLDIIYYTIGEIYEKDKNESLAILNYKLSIKNSTQNPKQKALSYLKLGEINFEQTNYTASEAYYDSTMLSLPKDYKDYDAINRRKQTLATLVGYIRIIQREDSLQRIAKMSDNDRSKYIDKMMKKIEDDEERKKEELENAKNQNQTPNNNAIPNNGLPELGNGVKGDWYFYNQTTLAFGIGDFAKKWGNNRKLEDNWRRSQKALVVDYGTNPVDSTEKETKDGVVKGGLKPKNTKPKDFYLQDLPLGDSLIKKSDMKIIDAYYNLGSTYKEELNNNKKAIATFEELNKRYDDHKYKLSTYYQLYRIFESVKNKSQADYYKNKLLNDYPNSEYAQIIKNPNYAAEKSTQKGEVEIYYTETYNIYSEQNYTSAYSRCKESESKFGKNDFGGKFAFIKALSIGKLKGIDSLESSLKELQALYPKDPAAKKAQELLEVIYNLKHPSEATAGTAVNRTDTFTLDLEAPHFMIAVSPDDPAIASTFKSSLADFNTSFYSAENISLTSSLFGNAEQITIAKTFKNAQAALAYMDNISKDKTIFSGKVKLEFFTLMVISVDNLPKLYKKKQTNYYKPFFTDHYKLEK